MRAWRARRYTGRASRATATSTGQGGAPPRRAALPPRQRAARPAPPRLPAPLLHARGAAHIGVARVDCHPLCQLGPDFSIFVTPRRLVDRWCHALPSPRPPPALSPAPAAGGGGTRGGGRRSRRRDARGRERPAIHRPREAEGTAGWHREAVGRGDDRNRGRAAVHACRRDGGECAAARGTAAAVREVKIRGRVQTAPSADVRAARGSRKGGDGACEGSAGQWGGSRATAQAACARCVAVRGRKALQGRGAGGAAAVAARAQRLEHTSIGEKRWREEHEVEVCTWSDGGRQGVGQHSHALLRGKGVTGAALLFTQFHHGKKIIVIACF